MLRTRHIFPILFWRATKIKSSVMSKHLAGFIALLVLAIGINVLMLRKTCAVEDHCWQSLVGHWYPALFVLFVAYHTDKTSAASAKRLSNGMIAFGVVYLVQDLLQKGGEVTKYNRKTIQHDVMFLSISILGFTRARRKHHEAMFKGELDKLLCFMVAVLLVVFMANHPQPTKTGDWMHYLTAFYLVLWFLFGVVKWLQRAQWAMWFAAVCFLGSQQGLCTLANNSNVDTVAYSCIANLFAYCSLLFFLSTKKIDSVHKSEEKCEA